MSCRLISLLFLMILFSGAAFASPLRETIPCKGTSWCGTTWGYNTPKMLFDGKRAYAVGLEGTDPGNSIAYTYYRDKGAWHTGSIITPVYQPPTIVLDDQGYINIFCTKAGACGYHWRSKSPGDVTAFEEIKLTNPEKFAFGYLGAASAGGKLVLVGLDSSYSMWLSIKPSAKAPWSEPQMLVQSQKDTPPWTSPVYPVVMPHGDQISVVYSNSPDGGVHNTYNRVEYLVYDAKQQKVTRRDVLVDGPIGEYTFGLDALMGKNDTLYALYSTGTYSYGDRQPDIDKRKGLHCATLRKDGKWETHKVSDTPGTGQLWLSPKGLLYVLQSTDYGTFAYVSRDDGKTWKPVKTPVWEGPGSFLYVLKSNSGCKTDQTLHCVQSVETTQPGSPRQWRLEYLELRLSEE